MSNYDQEIEKGKPIQLIEIDSDGKCKLNPEAEEILSKIDRNISVICVTGLYRTGKSYLVNRILHRQKGFEIGSTIKSCTKGIWIWSEPLSLKSHDVIVMDTEGLGSAFEDRNQSIDMEIFVLSILLSSYFIYNSMKNIDESSIEALSLVVNFAKKIQSEFNQLESYSSNFPSFLWVIRDFALNLINNEGKPITSKEFLENALNFNVDKSGKVDEELEKKGEIRKLIKLFFKERDCKTIVRPVNDVKKLRNIDQIPEKDIRPEFLNEMNELVKFIFNNTKPKTVQGSFLNGEMYVNLIKMYINALNLNMLPDVKSSWQIVVDSQIQSIQDKIINTYIDNMMELDLKSVNSLEELINLSIVSKGQSMGELRIFNSLSLQNSIIQNVISKIETRINETFLDIIRKWKEVNINTTSQLGEELINEYKNNDKPIDTLSLMELFREIYKFIDDSIRNSMKYEVIYPKITSFFIDHLKNQYNKERQKYNEERQKLISEKESLENLLTQHKKMNETLKNERDKEIERLKQDCQNVRLDLEARIDEKNKMIKTIQSSNDNVINDLKGNISELQLQIENKNKELKYKVGYGVAGQGGKGGSSMISDSIVEGVLLKLDTFKDNLFRAEIDKVKLSLKQEISYRVEGLQEEFMKKVSLLKKDCEKLVLQVKTDSKREIEEYKQIIKNQYDELTDFKCQINGQDYKIELYKEKIISYEKEKKTQQEHAELLKLLTLKLNTLMENISKKL